MKKKHARSAKKVSEHDCMKNMSDANYQDNLSFLEKIDRISLALQSESDLEKIPHDVLDEVLSIFDCDRAFLLYPCDPDAECWKVPVESCKPDYADHGMLDVDVPMSEEVAKSFRLLLDSDGVVTYGRDAKHPLPPEASRRFGFKSSMAVALYPKVGEAWKFGIHQCSYERSWTAQEERLMLEIGRRLTVALSSMLAFRKLRESEVRYRSFIDMCHEGIWNLDENLRIKFVNTRMCELLGYRADEMMGRPVSDFLFAEDILGHQARLRDWREGSVKSHECRFCKKNGEPLWVLLSSIPLLNAKGEFAGTYGMLTDITQNKVTEQKLQISEERFRLALETARIGLWDWDIRKDHFFVSSTYYSMLGYEPKTGSGDRQEWIERVHPDDRKMVAQKIQTVLTRQADRYTYDARIRHADGNYRWQRVVGFSVELAADGKVARMLGLRMDIDAQKRAEDELRRYKDHLEETVHQRTSELLLARDAAEAANRAKSQFLASMSHELRTPLNAILGFSHLLRQDDALSKDQRENLDIINRSGAHLLTLINDVLEIAKIEAGRVQLENEPFDLGAMVYDVSEMMRLRAEQKGLWLKVDQSSLFPRFIKGDVARLRQILINLVGNAVKFTKDGGVTVWLGGKNDAEQHLLIEIADTGPGINPEDQKRLFRPFVQLSEGMAESGTGLGLSIVKQYVEMMHGTITVESTVGKGTLFKLDLRLEPADANEIRPLVEHSHYNVIGLQGGQRGYKILIAEDQYENQILLSHLMDDLGLEVKVAANGKECVELYERWHPDLIWMDRRMPVMGGVEATRRIRKLPGGDKVKIVAVTASVFKEQRPELMEAGMDDFISKPYAFNEIYESLSKHLGIRFLYESGENSQEAVADNRLTPEMLAVVPEALRQRLYEELTSLDSARIADAVAAIASIDNKLGDLLSRLTDYFAYPTILHVLDVLNGEKPMNDVK